MKIARHGWGALTVAVAMALAGAMASAHAQQQQQQQPRQQQRPPAQQQQQQQPPAQQPAAAPTQLPPAGTHTVVVDVVLILRDSSAARSIRSQVERVRNSYQSEITKEENELRTADQELAKQRAILSPEAFAQRRRDLEKRVNEAQTEVQKRRRGLDQAFNEGMEKLQNAVIASVTELAQERRYEVVLPRSQVVAISATLDITPEVLKRVNQRLPNVTVTVPKG